MIELLKEQNVWDTLAGATVPVVMYGMGDGADKILAVCQQKGIEIADFFASDGFVRGHSFHGKKVLSYSEVKEKYQDFLVVLSFASQREEVIANILKINAEHPVYAPDVPVAGTGLFTREFVALHDKEFHAVYEKLDDYSKSVYLRVLEFKVSGKVEYLFPEDEKSAVYSDVLKLSDSEVIVDLGAYDGDTVHEISENAGGYRKIYAFEPDKKNFKKLTKSTANMENVTLYNVGAWDKEEQVEFGSKAGRNSAVGVGGTVTQMNSVDNLVKDHVTLLKMDIEGSELKAIEGAKNTIATNKPKLYICAYHRNEDMFAIPLAVWDICPQYSVHFRHHRYIPAWESNFYFTTD